MRFFQQFSKKHVQGKLELKIVGAQLDFLASSMELGTDSKTDINHWKDKWERLNELSQKGVFGVEEVKNKYLHPYTLYLVKYHPDELTALHLTE